MRKLFLHHKLGNCSSVDVTDKVKSPLPSPPPGRHRFVSPAFSVMHKESGTLHACRSCTCVVYQSCQRKSSFVFHVIFCGFVETKFAFPNLISEL